jgi:trans-aconitate methyltransferase
MSNDVTQSIRNSYDRLADEYARRMFNELQHKPFDRELLGRFAAEVAGHGEVCDMGCGPGHVARYLRDAGAKVFGLDLSPRMLEEARRLNPDISFQEGIYWRWTSKMQHLRGLLLSTPSLVFPNILCLGYFGKWRESCNPEDGC